MSLLVLLVRPKASPRSRIGGIDNSQVAREGRELDEDGEELAKNGDEASVCGEQSPEHGVHEAERGHGDC